MIPGNNFEVVYAEMQPQYVPLPTIRTEKMVLSRWEAPRDDERRHIAAGGDLFILQLGREVQQPVLPIADTPQNALRVLVDTEQP